MNDSSLGRTLPPLWSQSVTQNVTAVIQLVCNRLINYLWWSTREGGEWLSIVNLLPSAVQITKADVKTQVFL